MNWHFYLQLASLLIIVLYACLVFRNVEPLVATSLCVGCGFLFNLSSPLKIGMIIENSLGSFLALVGFIIMLGRGLGEILNQAQISHTLVYKIVYGIGVNTQRRVKIGVIISSIIIVAVLGTLAGGLAILAPILRPIAGKVGITKPSLAVLMQASGEEALILGPFAPPVVALLGVTGLGYGTMLIYAAIPIAVVTLITTWIMAGRLQRQYSLELFENDVAAERFIPTPRQNISTLLFIGAFILCVVYGLVLKATTSYVIFVMLFLALIAGLGAGIRITQIFELLVDGMKKNFHLFLVFILLGPMLDLIQSAGGFSALTQLFTRFEHLGGAHLLPILVGVTGAFGMPAASAAVIKMLHDMFAPLAYKTHLLTTTFAFSMLLATRITNFAYPGVNMFAALGFAQSKNVRAMIHNGLMVTAVQVLFLIIYSLLLA